MQKMISFWLGFGKCSFVNLYDLNQAVFDLIKDKVLTITPDSNIKTLVKGKIYRRKPSGGEFVWIDVKSVDDLIREGSGELDEKIILPGLLDHFCSNPFISTSKDSNYFGVNLTLDFSKTSGISMNPQKFNKDEIAKVFADYAKNWFSLFKPQYAWADLEMPHTHNQIKNIKIIYQPWVSIYGPEYIAKYGKEFLLNIPAYKAEEIDDGRNGKAIYIQLSQNFTDISSYPPFEKLAEYMAKKGIKLKPYRPKEMWI